MYVLICWFYASGFIIEIKFIIIRSILMSRIGTKINRTPVRSPSPDIANRNIISRTHSPIQEALNKSRRENSNKLPIGLSFPSLEQLLQSLRNLQEKHKRLERQYNNIKQQNLRLIRQAQILHYQNNKIQRQKPLSLSMVSQPQKNNSNHLMQEYEQRMGQMMLQLKRIHEKLNIEIEKNNKLSLQNENYKNSLLNNARQVKSIHSDDNYIRRHYEQIEYNFKQMMTLNIREHELKLKEYMEQLERRQNKIEYHHNVIQKSMEKEKHNTPQKLKGSYIYEGSTANRSITPFDMRKSKRRGSEELQKENEELNRKINILSKEVDRILKQNEDMKIYINEQIDSKSKSRLQNESEQCQYCLIYKNKILELQEQINRLKMMEKTEPSLQQLVNFPSNRDQGKIIPEEWLKSYLKELSQIKYILQAEEITEYINTIEQNLSQMYNIEQKIEFMKNEKEKVIKDLKTKLMYQDIELSELKRQNETMRTEIKQLLDENRSVKELVESKTTREMGYSSSSKKKTYGSDENLKLKRCLEEAINKINHLQSQISLTLKN